MTNVDVEAFYEFCFGLVSETDIVRSGATRCLSVSILVRMDRFRGRAH